MLLLIQLKASRLCLKYFVIYNRICMTMLILKKKNVKCSFCLRPTVVFHFREYQAISISYQNRRIVSVVAVTVSKA